MSTPRSAAEPRVAHPPAGAYLGRLPAVRRLGPWWALVLGQAACLPGGPAPVAVPGVDARASALEALQATEPSEPLQVTFSWRVAEEGMRFQGKGVARIQPPYRVRLDLFTGGGETLFQAALVQEDLRIPPWAPRELAPPPPFLWASMGVFRPGAELVLREGARAEDGQTMLRYGGEGGTELRFWIAEGRVTRAEIHREGHLEEDIRLVAAPDGGPPRESVYRNLRAFRELRFELESVEKVAGFPPDIWLAGR